jgi:bacteriocin-like protein
MDANSRKKPSQLEINDLIAEAVVNAEARRNQAVELLSDEELAAVNGGTSLGIKGNFPIIAGKFPIIAGKIEATFGAISQPKSQQNISLI